MNTKQIDHPKEVKCFKTVAELIEILKLEPPGNVVLSIDMSAGERRLGALEVCRENNGFKTILHWLLDENEMPETIEPVEYLHRVFNGQKSNKALTRWTCAAELAKIAGGEIVSDKTGLAVYRFNESKYRWEKVVK